LIKGAEFRTFSFDLLGLNWILGHQRTKSAIHLNYVRFYFSQQIFFHQQKGEKISPVNNDYFGFRDEITWFVCKNFAHS
jgi:hypothetical protein